MYKVTHPEQFREKIKIKIAEKVQEHVINALVVNLEKGIYNYTIKEAGNRKILKKWDNPYFVQIYVDRLRSIFLNLTTKEGFHATDSTDNTTLLDQLKSGELTAQTLSFMTHQEMNPTHWKMLIEQKVKRDANKFNKKVQASTDMFTCKKCRSKECTYYELQTRSADEPATIFVTCLKCGKNWKS
jgi:DNA-directed RNA polymerase subunit M/transcription elongation factor TFIIS